MKSARSRKDQSEVDEASTSSEVKIEGEEFDDKEKKDGEAEKVWDMNLTRQILSRSSQSKSHLLLILDFRLVDDRLEFEENLQIPMKSRILTQRHPMRRRLPKKKRRRKSSR